MKNINIVLEDSEYESLVESKDNHTWRSFILTLVKDDKEE